MTHLSHFNEFIEEVNKEGITYMMIRGFHLMPEQADTDLDIVVKNKDFPKFVEICQEFVKQKKIKNGKKWGNQSRALYYPHFTLGTDVENIPNKCYRMDIYSSFFFHRAKFLTVLSDSIQDQIFERRIPFLNFFIPCPEDELGLLVFRDVIELKKWKPKHIKRATILVDELSQEKIQEMSNILFKNSESVFNLIVNHKFTEIKQSDLI